MARKQKQRSVLVVEDSEDVHRVVRDRLGERYTLEFAVSQDDAYLRLRAASYDLVLLDLDLPRRTGDMDTDTAVGMDILKALALGEAGGLKSGAPVVIMTARGSEQHCRDALKDYGAADYLTKPFGEDLHDRIDKALNPTLPTWQRAFQLRLDASHETFSLDDFVFSEPSGFRIIQCLSRSFEAAQRECRADSGYEYTSAATLAVELDILEASVRKAVERLRDSIRERVREETNHLIDRTHVVETAHWNGYRLRPSGVRLVVASE